MSDAFEPVVIENENGSSPVVIVVDHASNAIPPAWGDLGLDEAARTAHIAWDPGALGVAREMSRLLDAPLIRGTVSRLVLDLNRPLGSATLIPEVSETTVIPGNQNIGEDERKRRIAAVYQPYHAALDGLIDRHVARCAARGGAPVAVCAIHTFTPVFRGVARPLKVGILFDRDTRLGAGMLAHLQRQPGIAAEANQPYSPADEVYWTLDRHAVSRGLMNVMIEIRNDEVRTGESQSWWAGILVDALRSALGGNDRMTDGAS